MHAARVATIVCAAVMAVQVVSASPVYSRYRGVSIGDSVSAVVASLHMTASDVAIVHARPAMIQQLTWRPNQFFASKDRSAGSPGGNGAHLPSRPAGPRRRHLRPRPDGRADQRRSARLLHDHLRHVDAGPDPQRGPLLQRAGDHRPMGRRRDARGPLARGRIRVESSSPCRRSPPIACCRMASPLACGSTRSRRRPGTWSVVSARS